MRPSRLLLQAAALAPHSSWQLSIADWSQSLFWCTLGGVCVTAAVASTNQRVESEVRFAHYGARITTAPGHTYGKAASPADHLLPPPLHHTHSANAWNSNSAATRCWRSWQSCMSKPCDSSGSWRRLMLSCRLTQLQALALLASAGGRCVSD